MRYTQLFSTIPSMWTSSCIQLFARRAHLTEESLQNSHSSGRKLRPVRKALEGNPRRRKNSVLYLNYFVQVGICEIAREGLAGKKSYTINIEKIPRGDLLLAKHSKVILATNETSSPAECID